MIDATGLDGPIRSIRGGITVGGTRVPLDDVGVLLLGSTATVSGGALTLLARYDVVVLNCMWNGVPDGVFYGWSDNSRIAARHRAQADLSIPRQKSAWQEIVKAKIRGQANACAAAGIIEAGHLRGIAKQVRSGDTTNCEAHAARVFWQAYFGAAESFRRVPGGADRVNAMLNYGYTVLRGFVIQAVCAAGLSPTLAIWHRHRANTFALADDLIEPFRPAVDHCVHELGDGSLDDPAVKKSLVAVASTPMEKSGATVLTSIYDVASALAKYVEGDVEKLTVPVWQPGVQRS